MIPACGAPCNAVLCGWFAIWFADFTSSRVILPRQSDLLDGVLLRRRFGRDEEHNDAVVLPALLGDEP